MTSLTLIKPDDWHVHLRDGANLLRTVSDTAHNFARALVMPNLTPPLTTVPAIDAYRATIINAIPAEISFTPLMTLYLTDATQDSDIYAAKKSGFIYGAKLYPAGATTNSAAGVNSLTKLYPIFEVMQQQDLVLEIHGEVTTAKSDIFDRERLFIRQQLLPIIKNFPKLRIVLEHISTRDAVAFIESAKHNVAATITVHHLLLNRNHLLVGGIKPHFYCLPILKTLADQQSLIQAAISGNPKFFLGTDSAPHSLNHKESACGCAGIYTAPVALPLYAEIFETAGALNKLESFASHYGADFYGMPYNQQQISLVKQSHQVPAQLSFGDTYVKPLWAGQTLTWKIADE